MQTIAIYQGRLKLGIIFKRNLQQRSSSKSHKNSVNIASIKFTFNPREPWATPVLHDIKLVIKWISYKLR